MVMLQMGFPLMLLLAVQDLPEAQTATEAAAPHVARPVMLPRDTPIQLMVVTEVTTKTHQAGHRFRLRVDQPVMIGGVEIFPVGTVAWGEVVSAQSSGNVGRSGSLEAVLRYIDWKGQQIPISGNAFAKGAGVGTETGLGIAFFGVLGLFAQGNNAKLKAGDIITGFIAQDTEIPNIAGTAQ